MRNRNALVLLLILALSACHTKKAKDASGLVQQYFQMMDTSNHGNISQIIGDTLTTQEGEYTITYSQKDYKEFMQWDAVFNPSYTILETAQINDSVVRVTVSKTDTRIEFMHKKPIVTENYITTRKGRITRIKIDYVDFDYQTFSDNKSRLLAFIGQHHPELQGFIIDQTETGGKNFLKAMALFREEKASHFRD